GHPDFQDLSFDLSCEGAVVVGNGNVAVDVARLLALSAGEPAPTDTTIEASHACCYSEIHEIVVLGLRGPAQAACSTPAQRTAVTAEADAVVDPADIELDEGSAASRADDTNARRNVEVLREYAARTPTGKPRALHLRFCVSPVAILGDGRVEGIEVARNTLVADGRGQLRGV